MSVLVYADVPWGVHHAQHLGSSGAQEAPHQDRRHRWYAVGTSSSVASTRPVLILAFV
jgi:hypothetical protein